MKRQNIGPRFKEVLAGHLGWPVSDIVDEMVVGRMLIRNEVLLIDLCTTLHLGIFINSPAMTVGQLIASLEADFDTLSDYDRWSLESL